MPADAPEVLVTTPAEGVLVVTIDRARARIAVTAAVAQGIAEAMDRLAADAGLRVGVLTGAGGTFCELGLVNRLVPDGTALDAAIAPAGEISANAAGRDRGTGLVVEGRDRGGPRVRREACARVERRVGARRWCLLPT